MSILINKNNSGDVQVIEGEKTQTLFPNRKCGAVTLTAGDIGYDDSETYASGTVGVEISTLKGDITQKYTLPSGGIPSSDLASAVQTSLGKADAAIPAPSSPSSGQFLGWNGSAWVAASLPVYSGGVS